MTTEQLKPCPFCGTAPNQGEHQGIWCNNDACAIVGLVFSGGAHHWNRRTPVEQSSTQTAEPAAWMNPNESFAPEAFIWNADDIHPEYNVPVFTHPAKTEQPAAPQQAVAWTVTVGEDVKNCIEITHCEEDARAQYAESTKDGYENLYLLRPLYFHPSQRQDSDKDALEVVHKFLLGEGPLDGFYFGDSDTARPRPAFWWRKYLRAAIANGAPK